MGKFDKKLSGFLVRRGFLTDVRCEELMSIADLNDGSLAELVVSEGLMEESDLIGVISAETNHPPINLSKVDPDPAAVELIDIDTARNHGVVPIARMGNILTLAVSDPTDILALDELKLRTQHEIIQVVSTDAAIRKTIDKAYNIPAEEAEVEQSTEDAAASLVDEDLDDLVQDMDIGAELRQAEDTDNVKADEMSEDDTGIVKLINQIILRGYKMGASDIHLEPYPGRRVDVRFRLDGELIKEFSLPSHFRNALVSRIKIMSDLDIAERRLPQDGKIEFKKWGGINIELRVATMPTIGNAEDVVMRILAASKPIPLDKIGMTERNYMEFKKMIRTPYGIILCVGPTGSGKTTTLHSALGHINSPTTKIWTAEDPVEITQEGLRQVQINRKAGLDFARVMRSFLRADPDVIMVGEMRDLETTTTGIEASLTGHLVLSTLHTNNAPETVTRLLDMGIDEFSFADALLGVLAQRLVRTLCKDCKEEEALPQEEYDHLRKEYGSSECWETMNIPYSGDLTICRAKQGGCGKCNGTGYRGRMGLHELLVKSDQVRDLIYKRAKADEIRQAAIGEGMRTLKQDGIQKLLEGHTSLEKIDAVCSE